MSETIKKQAYDRILATMQQKLRELTGFESDSATDLGIRMRVLAGELAEESMQLERLEAAIFPQTSTGEFLDRHAQLRGLSRKNPQPAEGVLRFSRELAATQDLPIQPGVLCATRPDPQVRFVTTEYAVLRAGELSVDVPARAAEPGTQGNVAAGAVCMMVSAAPGLTAVQNPTLFSGGADGESDELLRSRLLSGYRDVSNGANRAFYYEAAMRQEGVTSVNVVPRGRGRGTVDVFVACASPSAQGAVVSRLQAELDASKEVNVDILVAGAKRRYVSLSVSIQCNDHHVYEDVSQRCNNALLAHVSALGVGESLFVGQICALIFSTEGVYNQKLVTPLLDVVPLPDELLCVGSISVQRMENA